jgi:hypothetical protein
LKFQFLVSSYEVAFGSVRKLEDVYPEMMEFSVPLSSSRIRELTGASDECRCLPPSYPEITLLHSNDPEPGNVFITPFSFSERVAHLIIVDNLGMPIFYRTYPRGIALDFKRQPNGLLTSFVRAKGHYVVYDSSYAEIGSYQAGNGYAADFHGLQLLPNGHALIQIYDRQAVRMDRVVPGGRPDAVVTGFIVQELDADRNVVFQWRSWDHMDITDMTAEHIALTDSSIDYVHGNSIELDLDGNLLISSRHLNEITKIDRRTGEIIWRFGQNAVNNDFAVVNDARGFSHQHDARRLPNGNITLYDNGVLLDPEYSRAVEYQLDEDDMIATMVWEYRNTPDIFGGFLGNVQRRESDGTMIGWGGTFGNPKLTDLHPDGSKAYELGFGPGFTSYRAFRFPWRTNRFVTDVVSLDFGAVEMGDTTSRSLTLRNESPSEVTINCFLSTEASFFVSSTEPITLTPGGQATVQVNFAPAHAGEIGGNLYVRQVNDDELVAQTVALEGEGSPLLALDARTDTPLLVTPSNTAERMLRLLGHRPNPVRGSAAIRFELPRAGRVTLEVLDVRGRRVEMLVDEIRPAGIHEERWTSQGKPSGIYFYRLQQGSVSDTRKLVVLD